MKPTRPASSNSWRRWMPAGGLLPLLAALGAVAPPKGPPPVRPNAPKPPIEYGLTVGDTGNNLIKFKDRPAYLVAQDKIASEITSIITNQATTNSALRLDGLRVPPPPPLKPGDTNAMLQRLHNITNALVRLLSTDASKALKEDAKRMALLEGAKVAEEAGQHMKALNMLNALAHHNVEDPIIPEVLLRQGLIYRRMGQVENAISTYYAVMNAATKVRGMLRKTGPVAEHENLLRFRRLVLVARAELADTHYEKSRSLGVHGDARQEALEEALRMYKQFLAKPDEEMDLAAVRKRMINCLEDNEEAIRAKLKEINDFQWRLDLQNRLIDSTGKKIEELQKKVAAKGVRVTVKRVYRQKIQAREADRKRQRAELAQLIKNKERWDTEKVNLHSNLARVRREFINQITDYLQHHPSLDDQGEYRYLLARTYMDLGDEAKAHNEYNLLLRDLDHIGLSPAQKGRWMEWQIKAALDIAERDFQASRFAQAANIYGWLAGRVTSLRDRLGVQQQIGFCHARQGNLTGARKNWEAIRNIWDDYTQRTAKLDEEITELKNLRQVQNTTYLGTLAEEVEDWNRKYLNKKLTFDQFEKFKRDANWQLRNTAILQGIEAKSPAEKAGLQLGDQILWIDKQPILNYEDLLNTLQGHKPGDQVTLTILRDSAEQRVTLKLGDRITHLETKLADWRALKTRDLVVIHQMAKTRLAILSTGDQLTTPPVPTTPGAKP